MTLRAALQATLDGMARAYCAGDAHGCAAFFTGDAELYSPYAPPAKGRAEIEALHRDWTRGATEKRFEVLDCGGTGGLAWALARFSDAGGDSGTTLAVFEWHEAAASGASGRATGGWLCRACSLTAATG
jgi:ketosteroid isomerase-like protein